MCRVDACWFDFGGCCEIIPYPILCFPSHFWELILSDVLSNYLYACDSKMHLPFSTFLTDQASLKESAEPVNKMLNDHWSPLEQQRSIMIWKCKIFQ